MQATPKDEKHPALDLAALNEGLMQGLVHQHELTEAAQRLVVLLQAESEARRKAEEALIDSAKLASAGRMAAVLAHEINNPLAAVINLLFLASSNANLPDDVRQYLNVADGELKRIAHVTRQTLGFYKEQSFPVDFQVSSLLDSVCDMLRAKILSKKVKVEARCDASLHMTTLRWELQQALSNLLLNSLEAVGEQGQVKFRASLSKVNSEKHPIVQITIADNGHGISADHLPQIFNPFFTTKGLTGNGLGLWISKQIVEQHHGSIHVRSSTATHASGTTFSIFLPQSPSVLR